MADAEMTDITSNGDDSPLSPGFEAPLLFCLLAMHVVWRIGAAWRARCEGQQLIKKRGCYQDTVPDKGQHSPQPLPDLWPPQPEGSRDRCNPHFSDTYISCLCIFDTENQRYHKASSSSLFFSQYVKKHQHLNTDNRFFFFFLSKS